MDRVAVFVDAGYLFAQGSVLLSGERRPRGEIRINIDKALSALEEFAKDVSGVPLLRIYWYDGTSTGPSIQHVALGFKPRVKVRLGFVNTAGQQKGVDSLIVTDMITLARNHAMSDAVLMSGDEDIRVGVQQAQEFGVKVHVLGIHPARGSQSQFLLQEADTTYEWSQAEISEFLSCGQKPGIVSPRAAALPAESTAATEPASPTPESLLDIAKEAADQIDESLIEGVLAAYAQSKLLPPQIDRPLLGRAKKKIGLLSPDCLKALRRAFVSALTSRLPPERGTA